MHYDSHLTCRRDGLPAGRGTEGSGPHNNRLRPEKIPWNCFGQGFDSPHLHQKCARRTQEPVIYVAGSLFVLVCPLAIASDK